jgi:hypothetical protein
MRLSPFRESRVPHAVDVQDGLGAHFVSLRLLEAILRPWNAMGALTVAQVVQRFQGRIGFHPSFPTRAIPDWTLGFKQFSLRHVIRVWTSVQIDGFAAPRLLGHATFPVQLSLQGSHASR